MAVQHEKPQPQELSELVNKVSEELRPFITETVKKVIADGDGAETTENISAVEQSSAEEVKNIAINIPEIPEIATTVKEILAQVQEFTYKDKINKQLHEELQKHQTGLRKEFITPLLKFIIREYDRAVQLYDFYYKKNEEEPQGELFTKLLKEFNIISLSLLDLLDDNGVTPVKVQEGSDYSPNEHKILKIIETDDETQNGKIAECVLCGFRYIDTGRVLRQTEVNIFKLK